MYFGLEMRPAGSFLAEKMYSSTLRAPADPFARSAVSSQRSLLAAHFFRSAVSVLPSKPGRAHGCAKGPMQKAQGQRAQGTKGPFGPFGPRGPSGPLAPFGAQGGRLYATNAIPNEWNPYKGSKCANILNKSRTRKRSAVSFACRSGSETDPLPVLAH